MRRRPTGHGPQRVQQVEELQGAVRERGAAEVFDERRQAAAVQPVKALRRGCGWGAGAGSGARK